MIRLTIFGQPFSKANRRQLVTIKGRAALIKSKEALAYERDALLQIPAAARVRLEGPVRVRLVIYYRTEMPDLDESVLLDILQDRYQGKGERRVLVQRGVYRNDRQVREKHVYHRIDKRNPRAEVVVRPLRAQHRELFRSFTRSQHG